MVNTKYTTESKIRALLIIKYKKAGSWRKVGKLPEYDGLVPYGTLCSIANGDPVPMKRRAVLGLSPLVKIPACPICGLAHTHAHGDQVYDPALLATYDPAAQAVYPKDAPVYDPATQVVKPAPKPRKPRAARIAISKHDPVSAARTIVDNLTPEIVRELVENIRTMTNE